MRQALVITAAILILSPIGASAAALREESGPTPPLPGEPVVGFGAAGVAGFDAPAGADNDRDALAVDAIGRVLLLATAADESSELLRLLPEGSIDPSFGTAGRIALSGRWNDVALDAAGRIVLVGAVGGKLAVERFTPDGSPDATFGIGGVVTVRAAPAPQKGSAPSSITRAVLDRVELTAAGSIVASGQLEFCNDEAKSCSSVEAVVIRLEGDGELDPSFGAGGMFTLNPQLAGSRPDAYGAKLDALAVDDEGRVLLGGTDGLRIEVARLTAAGALDHAFAGGGIAISGRDTENYGEGEYRPGIAEALLPRPDGETVVVGDQFMFALRVDGRVDDGFGKMGTAGIGAYVFGSEFDFTRAAALDARGRILVAGGDSGATQIARFFPGGRPDSRFAGDGVARLDLSETETNFETGLLGEEPTAIAFAGDGSLVSAGPALPGRKGTRREPRVLELGNADGELARCDGRVAVLQGSAGPDVLAGADGPVVGFGGDDRILDPSGGPVCAGPGDDTVKRASGATVFGGRGDDRITLDYGGPVFGGPGNDRVRAGPEAESTLELNGEGGADVLVGGDGRDRISGGGGDDKLLGAGGRDHLFGGDGADALFGGSGTDLLRGGGGRNELHQGPSGPPQTTYVLKRPGLSLRLTVRRSKIAAIDQQTVLPCGNDEVDHVGFHTNQFDVPIRPDGRFRYFEERGRSYDLLQGRVFPGKIVGVLAQLEASIDYACGTGHPGDRRVDFVAHRLVG